MGDCCTGNIDSVWHKHWPETISVGQWPYFMVQWFCPISFKTIWWACCHNWDICSMWCKDLPHKIYVSQWPPFHSPMTLSYILKTIWLINVVLEILIHCDTLTYKYAYRSVTYISRYSESVFFFLNTVWWTSLMDFGSVLTYIWAMSWDGTFLPP